MATTYVLPLATTTLNIFLWLNFYLPSFLPVLCSVMLGFAFLSLCRVLLWYIFIFYLPITSNSAAAINVWNEGASADTSQLYLPDVGIATASSTTWLSFEDVRCEERENEIGKKSKKSSAHKDESNLYMIHIHIYMSI